MSLESPEMAASLKDELDRESKSGRFQPGITFAVDALLDFNDLLESLMLLLADFESRLNLLGAGFFFFGGASF